MMDEIEQPLLPVEIISDGVVPTSTQVEAVAEGVTVGTEIVWSCILINVWDDTDRPKF